MDPYVLLFEVAFESSLVLVAALLVVTYLAFTRMENDVRRARLFIMADRVKRFLGAFTLGFVVITVDIFVDIIGLPLPAVASAAVFFVFLGAIVYGSLELFLIIRPRRPKVGLSKPSLLRPVRGDPPEGPAAADSPEGGMNAPR